jgi:hypothetical protein
MVKQDILTIDQVEMIGLNQSDKLHHYYQHATKLFKIDEPTIFLNQKNLPITDPVNTGSIDLQVYHPMTKFINGRPNWIDDDTKIQVPLPDNIKLLTGHFIKALIFEESADAIPIDQFIINQQRALILPSNEIYKIQIINCSGKLVKEFKLDLTNKQRLNY